MDIGSLLNKKDSPSPRARSPAVSQVIPSKRAADSKSQSPQNIPPTQPTPTPTSSTSTKNPKTQPSTELPPTSSKTSPRTTSEPYHHTSKRSRLLDISSKALDISSLNDADAMASAGRGQVAFDAGAGAGGGAARQDQTSPDTMESVDNRDVLPKTLRCSGCSKMFARRSDLVRHERIHSGQRPHRCSHPGCNKSFIQRSALTVHERVHTGLKPHECNDCGKPFSDSSSLARHRRTHSGLRPYQCDFPGCKKDFTRRTTLTRHRQQHEMKGHVPVRSTGGRRQSASTGSSVHDTGEYEREEGGADSAVNTPASGSSMYHSFPLGNRHGTTDRRRPSRASQTSNTSDSGVIQVAGDPNNQYNTSQHQLVRENSRGDQLGQYDDPQFHHVRHQITGTSPVAAAGAQLSQQGGQREQQRPPPPPPPPLSSYHHHPPQTTSYPQSQSQSQSQPPPPGPGPGPYPSSYQQSYPADPSRGPQQPPAYYAQQPMRQYSNQYEYKNNGG